MWLSPERCVDRAAVCPRAVLVYTCGPGILVNNDPFQSPQCPIWKIKYMVTLFTGHLIVMAGPKAGVSVYKTFLPEKPAGLGSSSGQIMGPTLLKL